MKPLPAVLAALLLSAPVYAHDSHQPDYDSWYQSLNRPDMPVSGFGYAGGGGFSCCNKSDCHETEAEIRGEDWWARIVVVRGGEAQKMDWIRVPPEKVIKDKTNPTGYPVLCHTQSWQGDQIYLPGIVIYCFIPSFMS